MLLGDIDRSQFPFLFFTDGFKVVNYYQNNIKIKRNPPAGF
jgi:hypothetical protein